MRKPAVWAQRPALRCGHSEENREGGYCGEIATRKEPSPSTFEACYTCDVHRGVDSSPIPETVVFRRVVLTAEFIIAGVSPDASVARAEAVLQLERAAARLGASLTLQLVTSEIGVYASPQRPGRTKGERGDR